MPRIAIDKLAQGFVRGDVHFMYAQLATFNNIVIDHFYLIQGRLRLTMIQSSHNMDLVGGAQDLRMIISVCFVPA
ncbi:hypothetical protein C3405_19900 [Aeromonas hydrophila]|nr:hypothetical protein C3405_19900 [Aeromonas hydrophila]POV86108.1 hypothetical protein C3395_21010 [Aeromonas sp. ASNIH6]